MNLLDILGRIGFDWQVALVNLISFLIIFWILQRYAFAPIQKTIEARKQAIESGLNQAKEAETELLMAQRKADGIITEAKQEANTLVASAKARGDVLLSDAQKEAEKEQERIAAEARARTERELKAAELELEQKAAHLVAAGVKKILGDSITPEQNEILTKKAISS